MTFRFAALGALLLASSARAQPAPDTTRLRLETLLADVAAASPALHAARLEAAALAQTGAQVGALPDPVAGVTLFPYPLATAMGEQRSQWRVEQMVPWPGTLALRRRAADLSADVAAREADVLALDLAFEVRRAFFELARTAQAEAILDAYSQRLGGFAEAAAIQYEVGRGPQGAILQVQLEKQRLGERLAVLDARRSQALQTLARLTDRPDLLGRPVAPALPPLPENLDSLVALARAQRPEVAALDAARSRAATDVALARKAFYPELGVGVMFMDMTPGAMPTMTAGQRIAAGVGLMASARIPLQKGRLRARLAETRLRQQQVEARQHALDTQLQTQIAALVEAARAARRTLLLFEKSLAPQAGATVETTLAAYTTGQVDYLAFLDAERTRFDVQMGAADAYYDYLTAVAALERAVGALPAPFSTPLR